MMQGFAPRLAAALVSLLFATLAPAQAKEEPVVVGMKTSLRSKALGERRPILIRLPADHGRVPGKRYPVIYLLDGDDHFLEVSGMVHRLAMNGRMPDAIVVGIPNTKNRTRDLTPTRASAPDRFPIFGEGSADSTVARTDTTAGGATAMLGFVADELAPWVEARYRAAPFRILIGHSYGALLVLEALASRPERFSAYVALSPSLWWDQQRYLRALEERLVHAPLAGRSLYMTTGTKELRAMIEPAQWLADTLSARRLADFRFWFRLMPGEEHGTNPHRSTYDALETIFDGYQLPDSVVVAIALRGDSLPLVSHYASLSRRLGAVLPLPVDYLESWAGWILDEGSPEHAVRLFEFEVSHAPTRAAAHDGLARALAKAGRRDEAGMSSDDRQNSHENGQPRDAST